MIAYRAFGLEIASELRMDELSPGPAVQADVADLTIRRGTVDGPIPESGRPPIVLIDAAGGYFAWSGLARFSIERESILVDPLAGVPETLMGMAILGPLMAAVLQARGRLVLHASGVCSAAGGTALFLGDKGAGKSTMAAALIGAGCRLINDDVAALTVDRGEVPMIAPGHPSVKLSRPALALVSPSVGCVLPSVLPDDPKVRVRFDKMADGTQRLDRIYVLRRGEPAGIEALDPGAALGALLRFAYLMKFGDAAFPGNAAAALFRQCAAVASRVPIRTLFVPDGFDRLNDATALVLHDLHS